MEQEQFFELVVNFYQPVAALLVFIRLYDSPGNRQEIFLRGRYDPKTGCSRARIQAQNFKTFYLSSFKY